MICPNCGHANREAAKFCEECGIVLPMARSARPATRATREAQPRRPQARRVVNDVPEAETQEPAAAEAADDQPSGRTMLDNLRRSEDGRARRTFALVAALLILSMCVCCGAAAVGLYTLTQNPS